MNEEPASAPGPAPGSNRPRRAWLGLPLRALGSALAARAVAACGPDGDVLRPSPAEAPPPSAAPRAPASVPNAGGRAAAHRTACAKPTAFAPIADDGLRTDARRTSETDTLDWLTMGVAGALYQTTLPDTLLGMLRSLGELRLGYPISLLDHSLQTATRARRAGASDDLVLAALFHHIGMTLSVQGYAELSAAIVRGYVSEDAYRIVRYQPEYAAAHHGAQSGEPGELRARHARQSFHADAVRFADEWERLAYDPSYPSSALHEFEPLIRERFTFLSSDLYMTHGDCIRE